MVVLYKDSSFSKDNSSKKAIPQNSVAHIINVGIHNINSPFTSKGRACPLHDEAHLYKASKNLDNKLFESLHKHFKILWANWNRFSYLQKTLKSKSGRSRHTLRKVDFLQTLVMNILVFVYAWVLVRKWFGVQRLPSFKFAWNPG